MRAGRPFAGLPLFGTAAAGVVLGHWISYELAVPDAHLRHHVLLASGHGHWLLVVKLAVAFALAGILTVVARFAARTSPTGGTDALTWAVSRLALIQAVAFAGMEAVERLGGGAPVAGMFAHHLFLLGIAVQLLVACAGGAFLFWLSRTVRRVAEAVRSLPPVPSGARARSPPGAPRAGPLGPEPLRPHPRSPVLLARPPSPRSHGASRTDPGCGEGFHSSEGANTCGNEEAAGDGGAHGGAHRRAGDPAGRRRLGARGARDRSVHGRRGVRRRTRVLGRAEQRRDVHPRDGHR